MTSLLERDLVTEYLHEEDKENANKYESYTKLRGFVADSFIKKWAIENLYGGDIAEAHNNGFIHIHDLSDALVPYSFYGKTPILVRGKDQQPFLTSMEKIQGKINLEVFTGGWKWTEITNTIMHKSHTDLLKIETTNGRILIITEDHPMFKGFSTTTIPATELVAGDKLCSALFSKNFSFGKIVLPSKLAWLLGMYIAEGSKHGKNYTICQYESLERNKILKILERYDIDYTTCGKDIFIDGDNLIIENVFSLIESGAENKSIPSLSFSKETFFNIISGILDGDGWRTEYDDSASLFGIDSISYELIGQIKTLFDIIRIPASFRNYNNIYKLKFHMIPEYYPLFKESIKANRENIKFRIKEKFNFDYFNSQPEIKKIETIPWKGKPVYDISTESEIFSAVGLKVHNCKGHDATKILTKGLITQTVVADVPKHLSSFFDQLVNLIGTAQQSWAGAQAVSNLNTLAAPFVRKYHNELIEAGIDEETSEKLTYKYVKQCCQSFVYNLNFPSRAGSQTPFSNITFNFICPKNMRDEMVLASGCEGTWGDYQKEALMIIKAFNEVFYEGDKKGHPFTFPVVTINLIPETPFDHPLWIDLMKTEIKFGTYSFFNYIGSGIDPDSILSMCCLEGNTKIISNGFRGISYKNIEEFKNSNDREILINGQFKPGTWFRTTTDKIYRIIFANNQNIGVSKDHLCITKRGTIRADEVTTEDWMPFSLVGYEGEGGSFDLGEIIGLYVAEGSKDECTTTFSLNPKEQNIVKIIEEFVSNNFGVKISISTAKGLGESINIRVCSKTFSSLIDEFVGGNSAHTKYLKSKVFKMNKKFRNGLWNGWRMGDGSSNGRICTVSEKLKEDACCLISSVGSVAGITTDNRTSEDGKLGDRPLFYIRPYTLTRSSYKDIYEIENEQIWIKVKSIEIEKNNKKEFSVYDFDMDTEEELFQLANGLITHNCRIQVNLSELAPTGGRWAYAGETGCYDDETEILTDEGWMFFSKLKGNEKVLAFTKDKKLEYQPILEIFEYNYEGEMYHFKSSTFDLKVTPNHKMVIYNRDKTKIYMERADNLPKTFMVPKSGKWTGKNVKMFVLPKIETAWIINNGEHKKVWKPIDIPMKDWVAFFGIYLAEGNIDGENYAKSHGYRIIISQKKEKEREKIEGLLHKLPFNFKKTDNGFEIYNKQLWNYMKQFGDCYSKFIPREIKNLSSEYLQILLKWFTLGDGNIHKHTKCISNWTASKKLSDDLQELYIKSGNNARIFPPRNREVYLNKRKIYSNKTRRITESKRNNYWLDQERNLNIENYKGKVYCVKIPSHMMFVRRNGIASICGNSIGVVTINLGKLGYLSKGSEYIFMSKLDDMLKLSKKALLMKGIFVEKNKERFMPLDVTYGTRLERFFRTIGVIGLNEACLNMFGTPLSENRKFSYEVLNYIREWTRGTQEETGVLWNLEMTPAEGTATRLAEIDKKLYGDKIITQGVEGAYYYTSMVTPPSQELSILERIDVEENLLPLFTGGTVHRIYIGDHMPNPKSLGTFIERVARNTKVPYFDIAATFSVCEECKNTIRGAISSCPVCGGNTSIWDRIVGYYRPRSQANAGKVQEIKDRLWQSI